MTCNIYINLYSYFNYTWSAHLMANILESTYVSLGIIFLSKYELNMIRNYACIKVNIIVIIPGCVALQVKPINPQNNNPEAGNFLL